MDESLLLHASLTNPMRLQSIIVKMSSATVKRILQLVIRYICFYPCVYRIALPKVLLCDIFSTTLRFHSVLTLRRFGQFSRQISKRESK